MSFVLWGGKKESNGGMHISTEWRSITIRALKDHVLSNKDSNSGQLYILYWNTTPSKCDREYVLCGNLTTAHCCLSYYYLCECVLVRGWGIYACHNQSKIIINNVMWPGISKLASVLASSGVMWWWVVDGAGKHPLWDCKVDGGK